VEKVLGWNVTFERFKHCELPEKFENSPAAAHEEQSVVPPFDSNAQLVLAV